MEIQKKKNGIPKKCEVKWSEVKCQSLTKVGIYLPQCVFSHGQLYVAFSRAQDPENVKTFIIPIENKQGPMPSPLNNTYTSNVVYRNVLLWFDH